MAPPPPPPGPPPMPALSGAQTGQPRDLLLQSIRQGTKLKKTVTVDKSGPFIAGKVSGGSVASGGGSSESSRDVSSSNGPAKQMSMNGGPPGLGNLFAGGMPKLKPTGLGIGSAVNATSGREGSSPRSLSTETKNRGPPPQPPPATHKPQIPSSASDSVLTSSHSASHMSSSILPNKPPVGGYGKPNVAPKPPVTKEPPPNPQPPLLDATDPTKPSPPPKKLPFNARPGVNRAQSMRVPKSPPVAPPISPPFPPNKHNLVKNQSTLHQSQDSLNGRNYPPSKTGTLPHNFHKLALYPPNNPPPPAPTHRKSPKPLTLPPPHIDHLTPNPTRPPTTRPPSRPAPPPAPPPPPPHRTSPAPPPPPIQTRTTSAASSSSSSSVPPPPPVRNLSVRNGSIHFQTDIENRFAHLFHHVNEFPDPGAFKNLVKNYNTKASVIAKQPAPPPPVPPTTVQLGSKMWVHNTSNC